MKVLVVVACVFAIVTGKTAAAVDPDVALRKNFLKVEMKNY